MKVGKHNDGEKNQICNIGQLKSYKNVYTEKSLSNQISVLLKYATTEIKSKKVESYKARS